MNEHTTTDCLLFPDIFDRPLVAKFDQQQGSSDGGAILLKAAERRLGLTSALAAGLRDDRQPGKVQHELSELITQRVMAIALGYEDANDAARLASDPIHKLLVGRDPVDGEDLASQPTLSRFENAPDRKELLRMTEALADCVIERHRQRLHGRARRITIDMDPTDDPTHGQQEFSFFNRHYDGPRRSNGQTRLAIPETTMYPAGIRRVESQEGCNWLGTIFRDAHFIYSVEDYATTSLPSA